MSSSASHSFDELEDSPKFKVSRSGHVCTRRFIGKWSDLHAFLTNLTLDGPGGIPTALPSLLQNTYVADVDVSPYTPDNPPDSQAIPNPAAAMNTYNGATGTPKQCLVTVRYEPDQYDREWPAAIPKLAHAAHQCLRLSARTSGQFLTIPGRGAKWSGATLESTVDQQTSSGSQTSSGPGGSGGTSDKHAAPDTGIRILVPVRDIKIEQYYVRHTVDLDVFDLLIGKTNDSLFLGGVAGTVLYEGYEIDEDSTLDLDNPFCFKLTHNFRRRILSVGAGMSRAWVTWNHDYRDSVLGGDGGWTLVRMTSGALRYPLSTMLTMLTDAGG